LPTIVNNLKKSIPIKIKGLKANRNG